MNMLSVNVRHTISKQEFDFIVQLALGEAVTVASTNAGYSQSTGTRLVRRRHIRACMFEFRDNLDKVLGKFKEEPLDE